MMFPTFKRALMGLLGVLGTDLLRIPERIAGGIRWSQYRSSFGRVEEIDRWAAGVLWDQLEGSEGLMATAVREMAASGTVDMPLFLRTLAHYWERTGQFEGKSAFYIAALPGVIAEWLESRTHSRGEQA